MMGTLIALAATTTAMVLILAVLIIMHADERAEWATERKLLIDRVIARHAGEVRALDHQPAVKPGPLDQPNERPVPVGL